MDLYSEDEYVPIPIQLAKGCRISREQLEQLEDLKKREKLRQHEKRKRATEPGRHWDFRSGARDVQNSDAEPPKKKRKLDKPLSAIVVNDMDAIIVKESDTINVEFCSPTMIGLPKAEYQAVQIDDSQMMVSFIIPMSQYQTLFKSKI